MSQQILQVNVNFSIPRAELEASWLGFAQPISETPGLVWKVWLMNEERKEAGGIYLFESADALRTYVDGPAVAALKSSPVISNISAKTFDIMSEHSAVTRAPLTAAVV